MNSTGLSGALLAVSPDCRPSPNPTARMLGGSTGGRILPIFAIRVVKVKLPRTSPSMTRALSGSPGSKAP